MMRWILIVLVAVILVGLWVLALFFPEVLWFAEVLTAAVVIPVVLLLVAFVVVGAVKRARAVKKTEAVAAPAHRPEVDAAQAEFRRAVAELQRLRGGRSITRSLPWYLAFGAPAAGTSSLLEGLGFAAVSARSLAEAGGYPPAPGITIRASSAAVVVDVPARLVEETERDVWLAVLDELRRSRGQRPLEGVIVTVGASDLARQDPNAAGELAGRVRARLDEMLQRLEMVLPVYVVLTKADQLTGFSEFWAGDTKSDETAWGASFALDSVAQQDPAKAVGQELDLLAQALHARLIDRLPREADPNRRLRLLRFPVEFRTLAAPFGRFVATLGRAGAATERFVFRGFFVTSAPPQQSGRQTAVFDPRGPARPAGNGPKTYFAEDVLRSVVLPDRHLATPTVASLRRRARRDQGISLAALALVLVVLVPALASYMHNVQYAQAVQAAARALKSPPPNSEPGMRIDPVEPALEALRDLDADAKTFGISGWYAPRTARALAGPLEDDYIARLKVWMLGQLRPSLDKRLDAIAWGPALADGPASPDDVTPVRSAYELVKLYAILVLPKGHLGGDWAAKHLASEWRRVVAGGDVVDDDRFLEHSRRYLSALERRPELAWPSSPALHGARARLKKLGVENMPYTRALLWAKDEPPLRASTILPATTLAFLSSRGDVQVAGPFTANGWEKISAALRSPAPWPVEAEVERWAIDDATLPADEAGLRQSVRQRYFEDYAEHWLHFLSELALKAPADTAGAKDELTALQEGDGFFKTLFSQFKVNVVHDEDAAGAPDAGGILSRIFGKTDVDAAARSVVPPVIEKSFRPILGFAGMLDDVKTTGPAPLEKYLSVLEKLKAALDEPPAPDATAAAQQAPFRQAQAAVTELLDSVSEPTRAALSRLLMPPILGAVSAGTGGVVGSISADWKSTVWTAWDEKLSSRYPFRPSGEAANFQDFDTFFKPDGLLWKFVGKNLGDLVEERGDGKYVPKRGADATLTPEGLSCLTIAAEITEAFYRPDPGMKLSVQADWTAPNVTDAKFFVGAKETSLPKAQWSQVIKWFGEDVHVDWQEDGRPTQELGRHSFSLFDLFVHLGGLRQTSGPPRTVYAVDCPPLTLKVKPEGSVDALAPGFFSRLRCPPEIRATKP